MTKTAFPPAIKSRPVYGVLELRPGALHLVVADGEGAEAVIDMLTRTTDRPAVLATMHVIYAPGPNGTDLSPALQALGAAQVREGIGLAVGGGQVEIWGRCAKVANRGFESYHNAGFSIGAGTALPAKCTRGGTNAPTLPPIRMSWPIIHE